MFLKVLQNSKGNTCVGVNYLDEFRRNLFKANSPKSYWSILKTFLNNKKNPSIPENKFVTNFKEKREKFPKHFIKYGTKILYLS